MNAKQIYERVQLVMPIGERQFFDRLNDAIGVLDQEYGELPKLLWQADENGALPEKQQWVKTLDDEIDLLPYYHVTLADHVLYLSGAGETYEAEFRAKARAAWLNYWNRDAKGRRVKTGGTCGRCSTAT